MKLSKFIGQTGVLGAGLLLAVSFGASAESIEKVNKDIVRSAPFASCVNLDNNQLVTRVKNDYLQNRLPRWQDDKNAL
ncbi:YebF family protein, partial [Providencia alcalifaciens]